MRKSTLIMTAAAAILAGVAAGIAVGILTREKPDEGLAPIVWHEPKDIAPFTFQDKDGRILTLADFRGRALIVNFWATWCTPCIKELPALDRLARAKRGEGFDVLAISIDRSGMSAVRNFLEENEIEALEAYVDPSGKASEMAGAVGLPVTLIVDAEGREIGRASGEAEWDGKAALALADKLSRAALAAQK